jgi:hypothetical protein
MNKKFFGLGLDLVLLLGGVLILAACSRSEVFNIFFTRTPTATLTATPSRTPTLTPSATATETPTITYTASPTLTEIPTEAPTATETVMVDTATAGPSPTNSRTPTLTRTPTATLTDTLIPSPTETPTISPTPTPHMAFLRLSKPGWMSKVVSPIRVDAVVSPGENGKVEINLIGEDGRLISNQELKYSMQKFQRYGVQQKLNFTIPGPAEYGRLEIRTNDRWGRNVAITSVDLILMGIGSEETFPPISLLEPYLIYYPNENNVIEGGTLLVNGVAQPVNRNPLKIVLVDESGKQLGGTQVEAPVIAEGFTHADFSAAVPYQVDEQTDARLMIYQESAGRIPGIVSLTSIDVELKP